MVFTQRARRRVRKDSDRPYRSLFWVCSLRLTLKSFTAIVVVMGFVHGVLNGVALKESDGILGLIGIMATLFVIVAIVSAFIVSLKKPWTRIVVRVAGSWV